MVTKWAAYIDYKDIIHCGEVKVRETEKMFKVLSPSSLTNYRTNIYKNESVLQDTKEGAISVLCRKLEREIEIMASALTNANERWATCQRLLEGLK